MNTQFAYLVFLEKIWIACIHYVGKKFEKNKKINEIDLMVFHKKIWSCIAQPCYSLHLGLL